MNKNLNYSQEQIEQQAIMLGNRLRKNFKRLKKEFAKDGTNSFRLYQLDIPEIRLLIDKYDDHFVVSEYMRKQTEDPAWLEAMCLAVADVFSVPLSHVHPKRRQTRPSDGSRRYQRLSRSENSLLVKESHFNFIVKLDDYIDTGLFFDHRNTRKFVRSIAEGKKVLNLFSYTGSFSVYAAAGKARLITSVDASDTYNQWAKENFSNNDLETNIHEFVTANVFDFIDRARSDGQTWDLIVLDPPSYSSRGPNREFSVLDDHPILIDSTKGLLDKGGICLFSTNHQAFRPNHSDLTENNEVTKEMLTADFRNRAPHRCWKIEG
ncbi:MAG: class I SAM-dependent methyltransferase [Pseudobacteriovorax sp.]|nr:class I SAM-dependent methyltransferase [Pseudobacteriovorax sp.]